jgi:hypothetical protein
MYKTNFKVKYYEIQQELIAKHNVEGCYTIEDINDVCTKLFIDELTCVFDAESIFDDKIDIGSKYVFEQLCKNEQFVSIVAELIQINKKVYENDENQDDVEDFVKSFIGCSLFTPDMFYFTHQIICQQLTTENIDSSLLESFKERSFQYISMSGL